jgi:hypothetical protein
MDSMPIPTYFPGDTRLHALVSYEYISDEELERVLQVTASHGQAALTAAVDARNEAGQTPLHLAAQCAYFRGVETLLRYGADPIAADGRGRQAVHVASLLPQHAEELLDVLSQEGCDMSAADAEGLTPLHLAAAVGNAGCVRALMISGSADINARTISGETPLLLAIEQQQFESCRELLANGSSTDVRGADGLTPLMAAERIAASKAGNEITKAHSRSIADLVRSYSSIKIRGNPALGLMRPARNTSWQQEIPSSSYMSEPIGPRGGMTFRTGNSVGGGISGGVNLQSYVPIRQQQNTLYPMQPPQQPWRGGPSRQLFIPTTDSSHLLAQQQVDPRFQASSYASYNQQHDSSTHISSSSLSSYDIRYGSSIQPPLNAQRPVFQGRFTQPPHYLDTQRTLPSNRIDDSTTSNSFAFPPPPPPPPPPLRITKQPDPSPPQSRTPLNSSPSVKASGTSDEYDSPGSRGTPRHQYLQTPSKIGRVDSDGRISRSSLKITSVANDSESDRGGANSTHRSDYASGGESSGFESPAGPSLSQRRHQGQTPEYSSRQDSEHDRMLLSGLGTAALPRNIFSNSPGENIGISTTNTRNDSPGLAATVPSSSSSSSSSSLLVNHTAQAQAAARMSAAAPLPRPASRSSSRTRATTDAFTSGNYTSATPSVSTRASPESSSLNNQHTPTPVVAAIVSRKVSTTSPNVSPIATIIVPSSSSSSNTVSMSTMSSTDTATRSSFNQLSLSATSGQSESLLSDSAFVIPGLQHYPRPRRTEGPIEISGDSASPKVTPRPTPLSLSPRSPKGLVPPGGLFNTSISNSTSGSSLSNNHIKTDINNIKTDINSWNTASLNSHIGDLDDGLVNSDNFIEKIDTSPVLTIITNSEIEEDEDHNNDVHILETVNNKTDLSNQEAGLKRTSSMHHHNRNRSSGSAGVGPGTPSTSTSMFHTSNVRKRGSHADTLMPTILGTPSSTSSGIAEAAMAAASEYQVKVAELMSELDSAKKRESMLQKELELTRSEAEAGRAELLKELQALRALVLSERRIEKI